MHRVHAPELEDFSWFPARLRGYMMDFLGFVERLAARLSFRRFVDHLAPAFEASGAERIVEMASGAGQDGRLLQADLERRLNRPVKLLLTDLYPDPERLIARDGVEVRDEPLDATAVPADVTGFRFMCNSFHHLPPDAARKVLSDAVARQEGIAVMELVNRSVGGVVEVGFTVGLMWVASPFVRPFSWGRLFYTYAVPLVPLATLWDGLMSCLRIYSPAELRRLVAEVPNAESYDWEIGTIWAFPLPTPLTVLIGVPKQVAANDAGFEWRVPA